MVMKTKVIILGVLLTLIPAVANAKTHKPQKYHYTMTYHRPTHIKCPYAGCRTQIQP